ncbi:hypothetical protein TIFTF001_012750 [Ficus carica]|uniref:Bulb-type lectin domain-containing protein n=1 Tax=Ficus carica TaxID=3494 RepID=A0AA88A2Y6_FICCA|nr:hypothetical protein TIFTF001_012750 [Ficus carica]
MWVTITTNIILNKILSHNNFVVPHEPCNSSRPQTKATTSDRHTTTSPRAPRVWEANGGNPVREGTELTLRSDGNLILSDANGTTAWQTGTANKSVVGLDLLPNGNSVLHDTKGKFVWHSFDFPTDTLLVGQSLRPNGPNILVSGEKSGTDGYTKRHYRFLLEQNPYFSLVMHRLPNDNSLEPLIYFRDGVVLDSKNMTLQGVTFYSEPNTQGAHSFTLGLALTVKLKSTNTVDSATMGLTTTKYNSTYSILRIEPDGNLNIHTYYQYDTS